MPRTKAETHSRCEEEQKTDAVEDTAPVQAEEPKAPANPSTQSRNLQTGHETFSKVQRECVVAGIKSRRSNNVYSV